MKVLLAERRYLRGKTISEELLGERQRNLCSGTNGEQVREVLYNMLYFSILVHVVGSFFFHLTVRP